MCPTFTLPQDRGCVTNHHFASPMTATKHMDRDTFLIRITNPNYDNPGINCLKLFTVESNYFRQFRDQAVALIHESRPSTTGNKAHTRPSGEFNMYSLFNRSGDVGDTREDNDLSCRGKQFHYGDRYPVLADFIAVFPHLTNFRLNVMGKDSSLTPHQVPSIFCSPEIRKRFIMCRFHA